MNDYTRHDVFNKVYVKFCKQMEYNDGLIIGSYAAESPAEFFAVLSDVFFELLLIVMLLNSIFRLFTNNFLYFIDKTRQHVGGRKD